MQKRIVIVNILLLLAISSMAQNDSIKKNSVFIELLGAAGHYSINYDRTFTLKNNMGLSAGIGFSPSLLGGHFSPRLPIQIKALKSIKNHTWEAGFAFTPYLSDNPDISFSEKLKKPSLGIFAQFGYRKNFSNNKYYWGAAISPLLFDKGKFGGYPWLTLRLGYKF